MKRILILIFTLLLTLALIGCEASTNPDTTPSDITPSDTSKEPDDSVRITVDSILEAFDKDDGYDIRHYDRVMIAEIQGKLILDGEITKVVHIVKSNSEWIYVYELSNETDAIWLEENRTAFVESVVNGSCVRFGNIVVFGNSDVIKNLSAENR